MRRYLVLALLAFCASYALAAEAEPEGDGSVEHPAGLDPTRLVDPRGMSALSDPRRSPAGWLYAFPRTPLRHREIGVDWEAALRLEWGGSLDSGSERETRYESYADRDDAFYLNAVTLSLRHRERPLYLEARALALRREDQSYALDLGAAGSWRLRGQFSSLRHHYATDARSLLDGVGSEYQTLRSGLVAGGNPAPSILAAISSLRNQNLEVKRDRSSLRVDLTPSPALRLYSSYRFEDKDGARPFGGALGFPVNQDRGQWIESTEPLDAYTHDFESGLEWAGPRAQLNLRYGLSLFGNRVDSLRFENPFFVGDTDIREGRFALAPDNRAHRVETDFAITLGHKRPLQLGATLSWNLHRQDETLRTPTLNSGAIGTLDLDDWNGRGALSRQRADARIDRLIAHVYGVWSPLPRLRLRATGRVEDHDDDTRYRAFNPQLGTQGYISEDGALEASTHFRRVFVPGQAVSNNWRFRSIPTSYRKQRWELEADWRPFGKTRLRAALERQSVQRERRARERSREVIGRLELTSRDLDAWTIRMGAEYGERKGSPYDLARLDRFFVSALPGYVGPIAGGLTPPYGLAQHRASDLANRSLHRGHARAHWLLRDDMDLALAIEIRRENFRAAYGLRERNTQHLNLQWSWRPRPSLEAHLHYGFEWRSSEMGLINERNAASEDGNAGGPWFALANAWTQRSRSQGHNGGTGLRWRPHPKLELSFHYRLQHAVESIRYEFATATALAAGTSAAAAGDRFSDLRYRDHVLTSELRIGLDEHASLRLFHRYERSFVRDSAQRGLEPSFANRAVILAHADDDYQAHVFGVMAQLRY